MKTKTFAWLFSLLALAILPSLLPAATPQILSLRDSALTATASGDGDSVSPVISSDGRFVLFASTANDLTPGGNHFYSENVFLRDRASNTTALVSVNLSNSGGGNGFSIPGNMSTNGRFVVFQSDASNLVPDDTNGFSDIFVRDLKAGTTTLVSVSTNGSPANGDSTDPVITPDGRYVAFLSDASDLVSGDTNGIQDVFVRDLNAETNELVSVGAMSLSVNSTNPVMATPVITPDGRYVAFFSTAQGLVSSVPSGSAGEVYVRDRLQGTTIWASTNAASLASSLLNQSATASYHPQLSDDGRYVAFKTGPTVDGDPALILRYDSDSATTTVVNTNALSWYVEPDDRGGPEMTPDGRYIAFAQNEGAAGSGYSSVRIWDSQGATDALVSGDGSGVPANTVSESPAISADGQFVAFVSDASDLATNTVSTGVHIYLHNVQAGTTQLMDADTNGVGSTDDTITSLSMSDDGHFVSFSSRGGSLVGGDNNHFNDVFVRDAVAGTTELISQKAATVLPQSANGFTLLSPQSVSSDGRWVVFTSAADDLVANDTNNLTDVFARDMQNGTNQLVSVGYDGGSALGGDSGSAVISSNGQYVVFISSATNLVAGVASTYNNVYRRDLQTGTTVLVSVGTDGTSPGNGDSSDPTISPDGRYVAFLSQASNLASGITSGINTYWRDVKMGQTIGLSGSGIIVPPTLGGDGRYVAYSGNNSLCVFDTQRLSNIYTNSGNVLLSDSFFSAALSPDGTKIFYQSNSMDGSYNLYVDDFGLQTNQLNLETNYVVVLVHSNLLSIKTQTLSSHAASWSDDGRWLAFVATTNRGAGDDGQNQVYLKDFQTGTLSLIGLSGPATNGLAASSDGPVISGNGRFIAYRSTAMNTVAGDTNAPPNEFLFDRVTGSNTLLTARPSVSTPAVWMSRPVISSDGSTVAFLNWNSGLPAGNASRVVGALENSVDINAALTDTDNDGIPDWWMMKYFGHPTGQAADLSLASDDADHDGVSNLQEYLDGTSPVDPLSVFQIALTAATGSEMDLNWPAMLGRSYQLQYKTNLTDSAWQNVSGSAWIKAGQGYYAAPVNEPHRFYRLLESN